MNEINIKGAKNNPYKVIGTLVHEEYLVYLENDDMYVWVDEDGKIVAQANPKKKEWNMLFQIK